MLEGYGERIQYSIFRTWLTLREREKLRWELEKILKPEDGLLIVGICNRCLERVLTSNRPGSWPQQQSSYRIY
ncbi:CRISPR-associated endonuclease Cas2 [Synechococcus sp. OH20]|uniref:CRISPR-associated endonuclease Cas2 n=1 Tax=Synechococcus sp. OH20 TaxID=139337 RepID=UPI0039C5BA9E